MTQSPPVIPVEYGGFDWEGDRALGRKLHETVIYETHVKGLTKRHPHVPESLRGTYSGLAHPAVIEHLTNLGVTAVELMPVHQFIQEKHPVTFVVPPASFGGSWSTVIDTAAPSGSRDATLQPGDPVEVAARSPLAAVNCGRAPRAATGDSPRPNN